MLTRFSRTARTSRSLHRVPSHTTFRIAPSRIVLIAYFVIVAFFALGYIVFPIAKTTDLSLAQQGLAGFAGYADFFASSIQQTAIVNTLLVGVASTLTCGIVGCALAVYVRFFCKKHRRLIQILLMSPVMIPGVIIVVAFMQLYGESGMITKLISSAFGADHALFSFGGFGGIVFVITYTQYVYFYLNIYTALQYIDQNMVESVTAFGGGFGRILKDAILPVVLPALIISAMTTFVSAIGSYSAPALIGGNFRVLSTQIVMAKTNYDMQLASIEVMILLAIGVIATIAFYGLSKRYEMPQGTRSVYWNPSLSHASIIKTIFTLFVVLQLIIVLLPVVTIFYLSFMSTSSIMTDVFPTGATLANYVQVFTDKRTFQPLGNSLSMSAIAVIVGLLFTIPIAYAARQHKSIPATLLQALLMLPWCMPASVIAIDLINVFNQPTIFSFGYPLVGTFEILPIAYTIMALPLLLSSAQVAVGGIRKNTEDAARSLGAGSLRTFSQIMLPTIVPGILSGAILCFVRSMGEYTMSALLYGVYNRPISVSIVTTMQEYYIGVSMAYGALVILLCCILLFVILKLDAKRFNLD